MILGASFDTPAENLEFRTKQGFGFRLLCDVDKAVGTVYGAARPPDDDWAAIPKRVTFLIGPDQTIAKTYDVTDVDGHAAEVLEDIRAAS